MKRERLFKPDDERGVGKGEIDLEQQRLFLLALRKHFGNKTKAAKEMHVPYDTMLSWVNDKSLIWFQFHFKRIMDEMLDAAEELVMKRSQKSFKAATWLLKHHPDAKKRGWGAKIEISGKMSLGSWRERQQTQAGHRN